MLETFPHISQEQAEEGKQPVNVKLSELGELSMPY